MTWRNSQFDLRAHSNIRFSVYFVVLGVCARFARFARFARCVSCVSCVPCTTIALTVCNEIILMRNLAPSLFPSFALFYLGDFGKYWPMHRTNISGSPFYALIPFSFYLQFYFYFLFSHYKFNA